MNLDNQHLIAIKTTKIEYQKKRDMETDKKKKQLYQAMIDDLTSEEKRILGQSNILLDNIEKGEE